MRRRPPYAVQARVRVHAPADRVRERVPVSAGTVTPLTEGTCLLETGAEHPVALAVHLGWIGEDFEVLEPEELVDAVAETGDRLLRAARQSRHG